MGSFATPVVPAAVLLALLACKASGPEPTTEPVAKATATATPASPASAAAVTPLAPGSPAPAFSLVGSDGKTHALADDAGKNVVVVAWFPKAFTGG
jgi:hypothetical protein